MALNIAITVAQIVGGILSGSLALLADALHNFSDGAAFGLALIARRIARRPADEARTFGYRRVEVIGATINLTALVLIGAYLLVEAWMRFLSPVEVHGWTVIVISAATVVVDAAIAVITYAMSKESLNVRAAFIHNAADAAGAFGVLVSGILILLFQWHWVDLVATVIIASYILYPTKPAHVFSTSLQAYIKRARTEGWTIRGVARPSDAPSAITVLFADEVTGLGERYYTERPCREALVETLHANRLTL